MSLLVSVISLKQTLFTQPFCFQKQRTEVNREQQVDNVFREASITMIKRTLSKTKDDFVFDYKL